jgi:site-specific recombinase XerD
LYIKLSSLIGSAKTETMKLETLIARCEGAYSPNTLRGYRKDLDCFKSWCDEKGVEWLPADAGAVSRYVNYLSESLSIATVKRRLCAIRFAHFVAALKNPVDNSDVYLAVRRASLRRRRRPVQSRGLTSQILQKIVDACPDNLTGMRDAALISVGYDTLCRSSELAAMKVTHIQVSAGTTSVFIPLSKSDPFGDGRWAYLSPRTSKLLEDWLQVASIQDGAVFRGLHTRKVGLVALNTSSIRRLVKSAARRADLPAEVVQSLSGHSMRIGAAQDMLVTGFDQLAIMQAGGWKTSNIVLRYIENSSTRQVHQRRWESLEFYRVREEF